jgi:hypothetical protein
MTVINIGKRLAAIEARLTPLRPKAPPGDRLPWLRWLADDEIEALYRAVRGQIPGADASEGERLTLIEFEVVATRLAGVERGPRAVLSLTSCLFRRS